MRRSQCVVHWSQQSAFVCAERCHQQPWMPSVLISVTNCLPVYTHMPTLYLFSVDAHTHILLLKTKKIKPPIYIFPRSLCLLLNYIIVFSHPKRAKKCIFNFSIVKIVLYYYVVYVLYEQS